MKYIERKDYLGKLTAAKDKDLIKVITGIRRCGKSTLLKNIYRDWLLNNGVAEEQIIIVDLSLLENEHLKEYHALYNHIKTQLKKGKQCYLFIDEVQECPNFEKAVLSLYEEKAADIYVTGSNSRMLSGELDTTLRGRTWNIEMLPLSFAEFKAIYPAETKIETFKQYTRFGGLPYVLKFNNNENDIRVYLDGLFSAVFKKDIIDRYSVENTAVLEDIIKYVYSNIGSPISPQKITNTLVSKGRKVARLTVEKYLTYITDSMLCHKADRNDIKGKGLLDTSPKYYATDIGLRNNILGYRNTDSGHILENVVYFELRKRGYSITIGKVGDKEIDFIAEQGGKRIYVQVAETVKNAGILERELAPLKAVRDFYPRLLLSADYDTNMTYDGIEHKNVYDWLLGE